MHEISGEDCCRGLYIHIPFCLKKCRYCDFYSLSFSSSEMLDRYVNSVVREIELKAENLPDTLVKTVYMGGGTPSLLTAGQLERIMCAVNKHFKLESCAEICLEANPATLDAGKAKAIRQAGFNRLSLGVQSFHDDELQLLGRSHNAADVYRTIDFLHYGGITNYNIDLIYGLPGQTIKRWQETLNQAVQMEPAHISMYLLQLEQSTPMARDIKNGRLKMPGEESDVQMYETGIDLLEAAGLKQYEISNLARPGLTCQHNLIYWHAVEYIGIGAGAVSFTGRRRYINKANLEQYQLALEKKSDLPVEELEYMDQKGLTTDAIILGLRLCEGINLERFESRFGINIYTEYQDIIKEGTEGGLLNITNGNLRFTRRGYFVSNQVLCQFIV